MYFNVLKLYFKFTNSISGFTLFLFFSLINQNLGISLCMPKSSYQSQNQPVLLPVNIRFITGSIAKHIWNYSKFRQVIRNGGS